MTYGLTDSGLVLPRTADYLAEIRDEYEAQTGLSIDWEADLALGTLTGIASERLGEATEILRAVYDARDPNNASGVQLDILSSIVGATREGATASRSAITINGTAGTVVPAGSLVKGDGASGETRWSLDADATIGGGGTVSAVFVATTKGAISAPAGTITDIVTPVDGWDSITHSADATVGTDRQLDSSLRVTRQDALQGVGSRSNNAIRAKLLEIEGVTNAVVIDNPSDSATTIQGVSLNAHSVAVILFPNTLTNAEKEEAAGILYANVNQAVEMMGSDVTATVTGGDGVSKTVNWDWATTQTVAVVVTVTAFSPGVTISDVDELIEDAIDAYFAALEPGETVRFLLLQQAIAGVSGVLGIAMTLDAGSSDIALDLDRIAISSNTVS